MLAMQQTGSLDQKLANFFYKGSESKKALQAHVVSAMTTQVHHCSTKAIIDNT